MVVTFAGPVVVCVYGMKVSPTAQAMKPTRSSHARTLIGDGVLILRRQDR